jgi:hypothetical protein
VKTDGQKCETGLFVTFCPAPKQKPFSKLELLIVFRLNLMYSEIVDF